MGFVASVFQPSTLRMLIRPEASKAQNNIAAVSADGNAVCILIRRWCDGSLQPEKDPATMAAKSYGNAKWKVQIVKRRRSGMHKGVAGKALHGACRVQVHANTKQGVVVARSSGIVEDA
jgi:hypothetical protein